MHARDLLDVWVRWSFTRGAGNQDLGHDFLRRRERSLKLVDCDCSSTVCDSLFLCRANRLISENEREWNRVSPGNSPAFEIPRTVQILVLRRLHRNPRCIIHRARILYEWVLGFPFFSLFLFLPPSLSFFLGSDVQVRKGTVGSQFVLEYFRRNVQLRGNEHACTCTLPPLVVIAVFIRPRFDPFRPVCRNIANGAFYRQLYFRVPPEFSYTTCPFQTGQTGFEDSTD